MDAEAIFRNKLSEENHDSERVKLPYSRDEQNWGDIKQGKILLLNCLLDVEAYRSSKY